MTFTRTLAPTAAPVGPRELFDACVDAFRADRAAGALEQQLQEYLNAEGICLFSSGKAALTVVLKAMATLRNGRCVAIPAYTCFSVPAAVVRAGLEPVLVDINPATLDFDDSSLAQVMGRHDLLAIVPTHLFGIAANVERLRAFGRRDVWIVEDAAQALGLRRHNGGLLGTEGDAAVFSLARGKHLTCGSGGIVATRSPQLAAACQRVSGDVPRAGSARALRLLAELAFTAVFARPALYWFPSALPFLGLGTTVYSTRYSITRLPVTALGAMRTWRRRLDDSNAHRQEAVESLSRAIPVSPLRQPAPLLRFPIFVGDRTMRTRLLNRARILGVSAMYPTAIHRIPELQPRFTGQRFPGADAVAAQLVTLPTHPYTSATDLATIAAMCAEVQATASPLVQREATVSC